MPKTESDKKVTKIGTFSLAFRVKDEGDNLYSAEMLMLCDDVAINKRSGVGTTLGHAIGAMGDLADGWACDMIEKSPERYFKEVML